VYVYRLRRWRKLLARSGVLEHMHTLFDGFLLGVEFGSPKVGVDCVSDLIVARFVQTSQIEPDLADVRVEADSSRVGVESITVLVNLVIQNTDRTPEGRISAISVDSLLICLVCLVVSLTGHVGPTQQVPALRIVAV
jgi:hypothetical protein